MPLKISSLWSLKCILGIMKRRESSVHMNFTNAMTVVRGVMHVMSANNRQNHLSKSVFTQTTGKMLPWQPDSGGTSSFSVPVEMLHTNAARNGDIKWLVLCSSNFLLFLYLSVPRSLSHICTHLRIKSYGFSREPQFRNPMLNDCFRQYCWFDLPQLWAKLAATHMNMQCSFFIDQYFHLKVLLCMCFFPIWLKDSMKNNWFLSLFSPYLFLGHHMVIYPFKSSGEMEQNY